MCDRCVFSLQTVFYIFHSIGILALFKMQNAMCPCTSQKNAHGNEMLWTWTTSNILWIRQDSLYFCRKHDIFYVKLLIFTKKFHFVKWHSRERERESETDERSKYKLKTVFFLLSLNDNRCNRTNGVNRKLIWPMKLFGFFYKSLLRMEIYHKYIAELQLLWSV